MEQLLVDRATPHIAVIVETTILVVDDHRSFADLLSAALNFTAGLRCVGTASSASEGVARAVALRPDIVVMDIQMPNEDGLGATRRIRQALPETAIAVVTAHTDPEWISRAALAGASAFIPKNGSLNEMIDVLRRVRPGQMIVSSSVFNGEPSVPPPSSGEMKPILTARELEVLGYLGKGVGTPGIARALGITVNTCRGYVKSLHSKLGSSSQLETVVKAQKLGLIGPHR